MKNESSKHRKRPQNTKREVASKPLPKHPEWPVQEVYFEPFMAVEQLRRR